MIFGFSRYSQGSARGPIQYFTSERNPDDTKRDPSPEILRGDPELIGKLIDSLSFEHVYTSGVLSFAPGEVITREMEERIMDEFEKFAFAGFERDQYAILWVRHSHAGHEELNFLIPRVELSTGKSLNIAPPGPAARQLFAAFRSWVNAEYGLPIPTTRNAARTSACRTTWRSCAPTTPARASSARRIYAKPSPRLCAGRWTPGASATVTGWSPF